MTIGNVIATDQTPETTLAFLRSVQTRAAEHARAD